MPWWLLPVEFFGKLALKYGLQWLETKYPGIKPYIDMIIQWLNGQAAVGNAQAMQVLQDHTSKLFAGIGSPPALKGLGD